MLIQHPPLHLSSEDVYAVVLEVLKCQFSNVFEIFASELHAAMDNVQTYLEKTIENQTIYPCDTDCYFKYTIKLANDTS